MKQFSAWCARVLAVALLVAGAPRAGYGAERISSAAQAKIDEFMALRMAVSALNAADGYGSATHARAALAAIDAFAAQNGIAPAFGATATDSASSADATPAAVGATPADGAFSDTGAFTREEALILENFVLLERYNYMKDDGANKQTLRTALKTQKDKCDAWQASHKAETPNTWLLVTSADIISCYISFSMADVIKYGLSIKDYYTQAISQDAQCSYVLTNLAQWYYWAPAINGGSKKKAAAYFERAVLAAKTGAEVYFANIFLSQYVLESGDTARARALLATAKAQCPQSSYIALLERINASGISLFAYSKQRSKMDGKPSE